MEEVRAEALPFIEVAPETNELAVSSQAMTMLGKLRTSTKKIAVVVFAGPCRTGKSFIANRYLGRMAAFRVGRDLRAGTTTSGIWIWS